jgi:hypothetical protein
MAPKGRNAAEAQPGVTVPAWAQRC